MHPRRTHDGKGREPLPHTYRPGSMSRRRPHAETVAHALAGAFLAGDWEPAAMGRRGKRALGDRRTWLVELARVARAGFPERPADRTARAGGVHRRLRVFRAAVHDPDRGLAVRVWMAAPTEMGPRRWPVPPIPDLAALAAWLGLTAGSPRVVRRSPIDGAHGHR